MDANTIASQLTATDVFALKQMLRGPELLVTIAAVLAPITCLLLGLFD